MRCPWAAFRYCFHERRAASFAASLAAGVCARTAAAGATRWAAIGARTSDRIHSDIEWLRIWLDAGVYARGTDGATSAAAGASARAINSLFILLLAFYKLDYECCRLQSL